MEAVAVSMEQETASRMVEAVEEQAVEVVEDAAVVVKDAVEGDGKGREELRKSHGSNR